MSCLFVGRILVNLELDYSPENVLLVFGADANPWICKDVVFLKIYLYELL